MSAINILFYSNKCEGSKQLMSMLQSEKLISFFHLVCTDGNPKVPPQITVTPTLFIRGVPTAYVAGDTFVWLARVKQWKMNINIHKMNQSQQQYLQNINKNLAQNDLNLLGFSPTEMGAMSDIFSFFSKNIEQEYQNSLPQSYFTCDNMGKEFIDTRPLEDGSYKVGNSKSKINVKQQKELLQKMERDRKIQDSAIKQNIESFRAQYN